MMTISPNQSQIQTALRNFLLSVLPSGVEIIEAQDNRVPEPRNPKFIVMTPIMFERIETNVDGYADAKFTGSIADTTMTITDVDPNFSGKIEVGSSIFGVGVAAGTVVTALGVGGNGGGVGAYAISPSQRVASGTLSAGFENVQQAAKVTIQLDFHSDNGTSGDMAQTVSTLFRDDFAVQQFANQSPNYGVVPLLADDPKQIPFLNDQQQYEFRWVVEAMLQANPVVSIPQQFADLASVKIISVDATYAP